MNWIREAESKLYDYSAKAQSLQSVTARIALLESEMSCVRSATMDSTAVHGGGNGREDALINNIAARGELEHVRLRTTQWLEWVNSALSALSDEERLLLDSFYIERCDKCVERLCEKLCLERAQVYRKKHAALRRFTLLLYGET